MNDDYDFVTIGHETFQASRREYQNWRFAWVREILQNSIDAGATWIEIIIEPKGSITVIDNGCGMTEDILRNKLFVVNASGKNCAEGAVGGFGKAKELLYFGQHEYNIQTNDLHVHGYSNRFKITKIDDNPFKGTKSIVKIDDKDFNKETWEKYFKEFFNICTWKGSAKMNEKLYSGDAKLNECMKEFKDLGKLYKFKTNDNNIDDIIWVRVNGMPMFPIHCGGNCFALELEGKSYDQLTSNRDSLKNGAAFNSWLWTLAKDTKSALLKKSCAITLYAGKNGKIKRYRRVTENQPMAVKLETGEIEIKTATKNEGTVTVQVDSSEVKRWDNLCHDMIVQNNTGGEIPPQWLPEEMSKNANWVRAAWSLCLYEIHEIWNQDNQFFTGFVFCEDMQALYGKRGPIDIFLLKPCFDDFTIRYSKTRSSMCEMLCVAIHEFVHSLGRGYHDEDYANLLTDVTGRIIVEQPHLMKKMAKAAELGF